ncbi:MAG TPA: Asp-tRNA(Asn)/Glu-tRNA(Gln) amidotransferase subunit GatC [Candidatus Wunengus sp. YC60]|jgi:aspartyl-tRNA(Asn)/glutamyl-tRNA(Gln) amidotransferase subunit C|uniref:Asp-tRNA(Asn)/Glu-tRNA(Gln) amidotransferase subunit GatC n=1 Tax=Candidatus Wunengus sp. YC60 TaxID=3367697 RepID=UPI004026752B
MKIERKNIEYIANLSRIELSDQEKEMFVHQLSDILSYIEKLNKLNTDNIKPMAYSLNTTNVFREDKLGQPISRDDAMFNAPSKMGVFFKVPKVIE